MKTDIPFRIADRLLVAVGLATVGYHLVMVHWQLQDSTYHYITHVFLVMAIAELAAIADALRTQAWPLIAGGTIRPVVHSRFPLADAAGAHRLMESSEHVGKVMLVV